MDIQTSKAGKASIVSVKGRLDAIGAPTFAKAVGELIVAGELALVLDFDGLDYISSAGLRELLVAAKQLKAKGGQLRFANIKGMVKEVFDMSGFGANFLIDDTVALALAHIA